MAFDRDEAEYGHDDCGDDGQPLQAGATKTVSYVVRRTLTRHGAGNMELDRGGRVVGDRQAVDPSIAGASAGRRNAGHD